MLTASYAHPPCPLTCPPPPGFHLSHQRSLCQGHCRPPNCWAQGCVGLMSPARGGHPHFGTLFPLAHVTLLCLFDRSFLASFVDSNFSSLSLNVGSPQDTVLSLLVLFPYRHWVGFSGGSVVKNLLTKQET